MGRRRRKRAEQEPNVRIWLNSGIWVVGYVPAYTIEELKEAIAPTDARLSPPTFLQLTHAKCEDLPAGDALISVGDIQIVLFKGQLVHIRSRRDRKRRVKA